VVSRLVLKGRNDDSFQNLERALDFARTHENHYQVIPIVRIQSKAMLADRPPQICDLRVRPASRKCIHVN
jgi:hypothetical protein